MGYSRQKNRGDCGHTFFKPLWNFQTKKSFTATALETPQNCVTQSQNPSEILKPKTETPGNSPHEKIKQCLTDFNRCLTDINLTNINQYFTDTENHFYRVSVISVKYQLSVGLYRLYRLNIGLLRFLP